MVQLLESVCRIKLFNSTLFFCLNLWPYNESSMHRGNSFWIEKPNRIFSKNKKITSAIAIFLCIATFLYVKNVLLIFA